MKIVEVKHDLSEKTYWFEVPDSLADMIHKGSDLICDTRTGRNHAVAQNGVFYGDGIEEIAVRNGAQLPLRKVCAVKTSIPMCGIKIGGHMKTIKPSMLKLIQRLDEYYKTGAFNTKVSIGKNGYLNDGYTAYLVAKMFDLDEIPIVVESKECASIDK